MATEFTQMFPAAWSDSADKYVIAAMSSVAYGTAFGDPNPAMVMIPEGIQHSGIAYWMTNTDHDGAVAQLLGTAEHSPVTNQPDQLVLFFFNMNDRTRFVFDFMIDESDATPPDGL